MNKSHVRSPIVAALIAFVLTVVAARTLSLYWPRFHINLYPGFRVHHYVYGIFLLVISGYLALLYKGPRAIAGISLLYGLGLGLTFDEFGFWVNLDGGRGVRWNTTGLIVIAILFVASTAGPVIYRRAMRDKKNRTSLPNVAAGFSPRSDFINKRTV